MLPSIDLCSAFVCPRTQLSTLPIDNLDFSPRQTIREKRKAGQVIPLDRKEELDTQTWCVAVLGGGRGG